MIINFDDYSYLSSLSNYNVTKNFFNNIFIYKKNNVIMGFIDYSVMYERAELNYIFVKEINRNKGIASKLLKYMFDNINVDSITLEVNCKNVIAIELYKKFGFNSIGIRKGYYKGIDAILMERSCEK